MSNYVNFIQDLPQRSAAILESYFEDASLHGREVTLLLSIAGTAFVIPFERLRQPGNRVRAHPSGDSDRFRQATKKFNEAVGSSFLRSDRWGRGTTWKALENVEGKVIRENFVEQWGDPQALHGSKPAHYVMSRLRNALAHGSIFIRSRSPAGRRESIIEELVFVSEHRDHGQPTSIYDALYVSPNDFKGFILGWVQFLKSLELDTSVRQDLVTFKSDSERHPRSHSKQWPNLPLTT